MPWIYIVGIYTFVALYISAYNIELVDDLKERGNGDFKNVMLAFLEDSSTDESEKEKLDKLGKYIFPRKVQMSRFSSEEPPADRM
jgi:hypothetical protein